MFNPDENRWHYMHFIWQFENMAIYSLDGYFLYIFFQWNGSLDLSAD